MSQIYLGIHDYFLALSFYLARISLARDVNELYTNISSCQI